MSPSKRPSPDRQIMLKASHLHGMERPVRSFKSFIRAIPPRTSSDKPLPPIPVRPPLRKNSSTSSVTTVQTRSTRLSLWEAPSSWDNNDSCRDQSTPPFALRQYSPLLPEPPEDIAAMQADPVLWQQGHGPFQQTPLDPIHERSAATPEVPPRNPSRLSLSLSNPATARKNSKDTLPSVSSRYSIGTHDDGVLAEEIEPVTGDHSGTDFPSPLDFVSALSDMSLNRTAFSSSSPGYPRDQGIVWNSPHQRSDSVQLEDDTQLDTHGNELKTSRKGSICPGDSSDRLDEVQVSDKMQALIFAQDYHKVLADPAFNEHDHDIPPRTLPQDQDLAPRPLMWKKESGCPPPSDAPQRPQLPPTSSSGRYRNLKMMSSWVNHRLRRDSWTGLDQRSASDPGIVSRPQIPESEVDRHLKHEARLANMVQHGKDFVSRKILRRETEPISHLLISPPLPQLPVQAPADHAMSAAQFEIATPVLRLPGGLALVRQSPASTSRPQTANGSPSSPFSDLSWPDLPVSSPFQRNFSRRGSSQSTQSQPHVASPSAFRRKLSSPLASPPGIRSFSFSTTSLPTSMPQEPPSPSSAYKSPQTRRRSHNIGSPLTALHSSHGVAQHAQDSIEAVIHKLNLFEKAKHAHDVWKKHQKEAKTERLKQSIRLIGPADAKDIAGYIKCAVDGRVSGDSGVGEGQLPGHGVQETV